MPAPEREMSTQFLTPEIREDEEEVERSLRPRRLDEFVGQPALKEHLGIMLEAARRRGQAMDHVLFAGQSSIDGIVAPIDQHTHHPTVEVPA